MKEVKTKRGKIGFGQEKIILNENYLDYFRNLYRELWKEGEHHHMVILFLIVFAFSYGLTMIVASLLFLSPGDIMVFGVSAVLVYGSVWVLQRLRGFTTDRKIRYDSIETVELVRGRKWFTCPRFIVRYGEDSRRYVSMHSHLIPGVEKRIDEITEGFEAHGIDIN